MKLLHRSYRIMKWSKLCCFICILLWIISISHQTTRTCNATHMNSHFGLLKFLDDKMIEEKRNNDLNLTGETKKWHIDEHIFHTPKMHLPLNIDLAYDPICILWYSTSNFLEYRNDTICNPQWFEFDWRMLKIAHKWEIFYTLNIHLSCFMEETNSLMWILSLSISIFCWCINGRGAHIIL